MLTMQERAVAVAVVESSTWNWELKVDAYGLFRWYLNGTIETNLRGASLDHAVSSLRRFVDGSLRGELNVTYSPKRIGPDSEIGPVAFLSQGAG
jgi:hypothetical protein